MKLYVCQFIAKFGYIYPDGFLPFQGARNLVLLLVAGSMGIAGSVMVGYSKRTGG